MPSCHKFRVPTIINLMNYHLSKSSMIRVSGDKSFVFDVGSDDVIVRFCGHLAKLPDYLKSSRSSKDIVEFSKATEAEVAVLIDLLKTSGLLEGSPRSQGTFEPSTLVLGGEKVEFMNFEQLLPEGANDAVYASYCACNCCGYCDNCSCSDC